MQCNRTLLHPLPIPYYSSWRTSLHYSVFMTCKRNIGSVLSHDQLQLGLCKTKHTTWPHMEIKLPIIMNASSHNPYTTHLRNTSRKSKTLTNCSSRSRCITALLCLSCSSFPWSSASLIWRSWIRESFSSCFTKQQRDRISLIKAVGNNFIKPFSSHKHTYRQLQLHLETMLKEILGSDAVLQFSGSSQTIQSKKGWWWNTDGAHDFRDIQFHLIRKHHHHSHRLTSALHAVMGFRWVHWKLENQGLHQIPLPTTASAFYMPPELVPLAVTTILQGLTGQHKYRVLPRVLVICHCFHGVQCLNGAFCVPASQTTLASATTPISLSSTVSS